MTETTAGSAAARPSAPAKPVYTVGYKRLVLALLVTAYTFNFIDRTIIATIGQAIKLDLKISDTQLGLLGGLYFALLYTLLGIPIARFAERFSRVNIISGAIVIWSAFTALCGVASSFLMLGAFRFGVGIGEAGLSPPSHSLISDYFEPKRRASALSIYSFGIPLGTMLGAILGGYLVQNFSWRIAFMIVGVPGVLVAIAIKLLIKEPPRGHSEPISPLPEEMSRSDRGGLAAGQGAVPTSADAVTFVEPAKPPATLGGELSEIWAVMKILFAKWPVVNMVLGVTLVSFAGYGAGQFIPPYFIRTFHLNYAQVGLITGLAGGFSSGLGTLLGGFLSDRMSRLSARWYALIPAIGLTIATPLYMSIYLAPTWQIATMLFLIPGLFAYTYLGPTFGVIQNMVDTRRRATATAILFFFLNLIALGGGPPFTGWVIDHFASFHLANPDASGFFQSVGGFLSAPREAFQHACPGGVGPKGGPAAIDAACKASLVLATRHGILIAYLFALWGAFHYFLASIGLKEAMAKARADRGEAD